MKAGHELDALVDEKVMGYINWGIYHFKPEYSNNMFFAWKVVEKMDEEPASIRQKFVKELGLDFSGDMIFEVTPKKICLAALTAKGVEVDGR